jgi:hypothetical protein
LALRAAAIALAVAAIESDLERAARQRGLGAAAPGRLENSRRLPTRALGRPPSAPNDRARRAPRAQAAAPPPPPRAAAAATRALA